MSKISIIILNYNSGDYLKKCIDSIKSNTLDKKDYEIIIIDNHSTDKSSKDINIPKIFFRKINDGFSKGNNYGVKKISPTSKYVFFLNPDTILEKNTLSKIIDTFEKDKKIDAIAPKIILKTTGNLQPEAHRGFPYPLRAFLHFSKIDSSGYFQTNLDLNKNHKVEAGVGAAIVLRKEMGEKIGWWDEDYFMYGEDIQLCWDIKKYHFDLYFIPSIKLTHFQGISSGIKQHTNSNANLETKKRSIMASTQAMRIFHKKNLSKNYPSILNSLVYKSIDILEKLRLAKLST